MSGYYGTFKGYPVYKISRTEYITKKKYNTKDDVFWIDDELIQNNRAIGKLSNEGRVENYSFGEQRVYYAVESVKAPEMEIKMNIAPVKEVVEAKTADDLLEEVYKWQV